MAAAAEAAATRARSRENDLAIEKSTTEQVATEKRKFTADKTDENPAVLADFAAEDSIGHAPRGNPGATTAQVNNDREAERRRQASFQNLSQFMEALSQGQPPPPPVMIPRLETPTPSRQDEESQYAFWGYCCLECKRTIEASSPYYRRCSCGRWVDEVHRGRCYTSRCRFVGQTTCNSCGPAHRCELVSDSEDDDSDLGLPAPPPPGWRPVFGPELPPGFPNHAAP